MIISPSKIIVLDHQENKELISDVFNTYFPNVVLIFITLQQYFTVLEEDILPSLLIINYSYPEADIPELCRKTKKSKNSPDIVLLIESGTSSGLMEDDLDSYADCLVQLPLNKMVFYSQVKNIFKKKPDFEKAITSEYCKEYVDIIFQSLHETIVAIIDKETKHTMIWGSPELDKRYGIKSSEFVNKSFTELSADRKNEWQIVEEIFKNGKPFRAEVSVTFPTGKFWHDVSFSPITGKNNDITAVIAFIRDITKRITIENVLKERNCFIEAILDNLPVGVAVITLEGLKNYVNKKFIEIYGWPEEELLNIKDYFTKLFPDKAYRRSVYRRIMRELKEEQTSKAQCDVWITTRNGERKLIRIEIIRLIDQNLLLSTAEDITKEHNLKERFQYEQQLLQTLMDTIPDTIYFKDMQCRFIRVNKAETRLLNDSSPVNVVGKTDFDYYERDYAINCYNDDKAVINEGRPLIDKVEKIKRKDGKEYWVASSKIAIRDEHNRITGLVGITRDITQRKQAEFELIRAKERAEESDRLKTAFLANLSHEIRTPMNAIVGFSNLIGEPEMTEKARKECIASIHDACNALLYLIDNIIEISKIDSNQIKINLSDFNINLIIKELYDLINGLKLQEAKSHIDIRMSIPEQAKDIIVMSDEYRLRQILSNLVKNALKFTDKGYIGFGYTIEQSIPGNNSYLQFFVSDTGIGIPQGKLNQIFDRFCKVEHSNTKLYSGAGLGLSISKRLVELLGGKIWVESVIGKGTTFYFTLPYMPLGIAAKNLSGKKKDEVYYNWKDKTVLIAEDEETNFKYLEAVLRKTKARILRAKNGVEAISICRNNQDIDIVLMDIKMPIMDGYEATRAVKQINLKIPVIAQTAHAQTDVIEKIHKAGCDTYLIKPLNKDKLLKLLSHYLESGIMIL